MHAELKVQVMDEDLTSDDLVGERKINLLEEGFLRPNKQLRGHPIYVYYDKKVAGVVQLEFRFLLDEFWPSWLFNDGWIFSKFQWKQ